MQLAAQKVVCVPVQLEHLVWGIQVKREAQLQVQEGAPRRLALCPRGGRALQMQGRQGGTWQTLVRDAKPASRQRSATRHVPLTKRA